MASLLGDAVNLARKRLGIPDRGHGERDEPTRVRAAPFVDVPVVVRLRQGERRLLVVEGGEQPAGEPGQRWEVERAEHPVGVHVEDALLDVEAPFPDLVEAGRVDPVLLGRTSRDRVEADVRHLEFEELPHVGAVVLVDDLGREIPVLGGEMALEQVGRLDHVVVDADDDHVLGAHRGPLRRLGLSVPWPREEDSWPMG